VSASDKSDVPGAWPDHAAPPAAQAAASPPARSRHGPIPSEAVLRGQSTVEIEHNGHVYRLQTTRQGKLILTK
jgi:hemin uptake protein HemP